MLKTDGKIKDYTYSDTGLELVDSEKYLAGYSGEFFMPDANQSEVTLGPFDYDGDEQYPDNAMKTYKFADAPEFYSLFTFTKIKDGNVVREDVDYKEISIEKALEHIEYGGYGFVWFDEKLQVRKILFYGATVAEE